jgi:glycosyltransferase involved in cell wall biosynthesis
MAETSDISVVIPYYNRERYIDETIHSVLTQTLKPLEILIVNDCSRQSSRRYIDRYADACRIVDLQSNVGLAGSRNAGIRCARGKFLAFLDDDDIWLPRKLEIQREYMQAHPDCGAVHCAAWAFFADRPDVLWPRNWPGSLKLSQALTDGYCVLIPTTLIRADVVHALGGFDSRFRQCEDRDFVIRCCAAGYRIDAIPEPLARIRRQGQDSLTKQHWRIYRSDLRLCWKHRAHYYRAYGLRGIFSHALEKIQYASCKTRYVDGGVRFLLRFVNVTYKERPDYHDPVPSRMPGHPAAAAINGS